MDRERRLPRPAPLLPVPFPFAVLLRLARRRGSSTNRTPTLAGRARAHGVRDSANRTGRGEPGDREGGREGGTAYLDPARRRDFGGRQQGRGFSLALLVLRSLLLARSPFLPFLLPAQFSFESRILPTVFLTFLSAGRSHHFCVGSCHCTRMPSRSPRRACAWAEGRVEG